ncbi:hypothetical protein PN36_02510 [Candidatus Thiomargarita nelsonii]|uniref:Uncharacterized protein n=1 Tax=Candidatus Thiomargarita nelsonii TaxID=1003181 RepID=A0A4E0RL44_9GAMM|nr:hypothetical protein PN36_02510 [Candidatus Thiomargarita nelsonii]
MPLQRTAFYVSEAKVFASEGNPLWLPLTKVALTIYTGVLILIKQDFFATLFMTGLGSILTQTADLYFFKKSSLNKLRQTVNNMVSFNAIKNFRVELFYNLL